MKKTDIERIIKQGSTKQKIKLYFTDIAYFNTVGMYTAELIGSGDTATVNRPEKILTDKERDIIFNSIKEPKDIKYWEELRTWNKAFLMFKPQIKTYRYRFTYLYSLISNYANQRILHKTYEEAINDILSVVEEKKLREKLAKTAITSLKQFNTKIYQEKGFLPFIETPLANSDFKVSIVVEMINEEAKETKEYINTINVFLSKQLPLQPYKIFVKEEEDKIITEVNKCIELITWFDLGKTVKSPLDMPLQTSTKKKVGGGKDKEYERELEIELKNIKIHRWEDIEVKVTDEDIEDIKNAGR